MELKYIIFFGGSLVCVPLGALLATNYQKVRDFVFFALVFGTAQPSQIFGLPSDINFLSHEWYRGTTTGIEISYLDLLAIILLISSLNVRRRIGRPFFWPPSLGFLLAYLAWCTVNVVITSDPKIFGFFELTKIGRGILLFVAVVAYVRGPREVVIFVWALILTICYQVGICLRDRYVFGLHRVSGTLPHPNSLSMYSLQCIPLFIVVVFSSHISSRLRNAAGAAFIASFACVLFSVSRTGFAALIVLTVVTAVLCTGLRLSARNIAIGTVLVMIGTAMLLKSWDTTIGRLGVVNLRQEYLTEEGDRGSYFRKGGPALRENPVFGVGLNNWSYWMSNRYAEEAGYSSEPYPSINFAPEYWGQEPPAHNLYLITVVELGWPGLFIFAALLLRWLWISGGVLLVKKRDFMGQIRLGAFLSFCGALIQSLTEWEFRQTSMFFLAHVVMGVAAVLYKHRPNSNAARHGLT